MVIFKIRILYFFIKMRWKRGTLKTLQQVKEYQKRLFRKHQKRLSKSDFYKDLSDKEASLTAYPIINKSIFMRDFNEINTMNIDKNEAIQVAVEAEKSRDFSPEINGITIGLSSGTSGNKGLFLVSKEERARWVACVLDRVIGWEWKKRKVAFFLRANSNLYESVKSIILEFNFFDLMAPFEKNVAKLNKVKPDILVAPPSVLLEIAKAKKNGMTTILPKKIISVAEVLEPQDKLLLEKIFGQTIHQVYQCTEGFLATSCEKGVLHFNEDFLIIEKKYLDEKKNRYHPIITDLARISQPVIRYELNDIIIEKDKCECGSPFMAIEQIEGRSDDILKFKNRDGQMVNIYPDFIRRSIIMTSELITFYSVTQTGITTMECYLEVDNNLSEIEKKVEASIHDLLDKFNIEPIEIIFNHKFTLEKGMKLKRVRNEYHQAV